MHCSQLRVPGSSLLFFRKRKQGKMAGKPENKPRCKAFPSVQVAI